MKNYKRYQYEGFSRFFKHTNSLIKLIFLLFILLGILTLTFSQKFLKEGILHSIVIEHKKFSPILSSSIEENTLRFVINFDE